MYVDGSPLTDLASYNVYYGTTDPPCPGATSVSVASPTASPGPDQTVAATLTGLATGTAYFVAVTAVTAAGSESPCSAAAASAAARSEFSVSPTGTVDFGTVNIGSIADQTFTVQNTGGGTVSGTATVAAPFSVVSGGSFNLVGAGATATVTVRFTPVTGLITATNVTFTANGGSMSRGVTGTGLVGTNPAPVLTSVSPTTATAGGAALTLTANGSNFVAGSTLQWNGAARTTTFVSATQLTATIAAADIATAGSASVTVGNPDLQVSNAQPFTITAAPSLTASITNPAEGATVSGSMPVGMSESNGTGTITWTLGLDGGATPNFTTSGTATTASFNWDTTGLAPGAHQLQLTVQDGAGRTATATRNVTVGSPGTITVFITQPGTDGTTVSGTVWFTIWLENASGSRTLTLSIDGAAVATTTTTSNGPISIPWNSAGAAGGTHTATVSVRDSVNNTGIANRTLVIPGGSTPLVASIDSPTEGATAFGNVAVGMSESGAGSTPITFTLTVDGGQVFSTAGTSATASFVWNSNSVSNGAHTLGLTVQDGAGRTATATRNVTVTSPPPLTASITTPADGATVNGTVTVGMSESNGTGTITWTLGLDGGATPIFTTSGTATTASFNWDTTGLAPGAHQLQLRVQDGGGRTATATSAVTVQPPPPATIKVFITQPGADGATVSGTTWFTIWIENAAGGNKAYTMSVDGTVVGTTNTTSSGPVSMPWMTNGTTNGPHSVTISVGDSAGGSGQAVRAVNVAN